MSGSKSKANLKLIQRVNLTLFFCLGLVFIIPNPVFAYDPGCKWYSGWLGSCTPTTDIDKPKPVHQYITQQAKDVWSETPQEIKDYLDSSIYSSLDDNGYNSGEDIIIGSGEEDIESDKLCPTDSPNCNHFWEPNNPQSGAYNDGVLFYGSAYTRALDLWENYVIQNYPDPHLGRVGNLEKAYYYLGRVAHLLEDLTVPAHVHKDIHAGWTLPDSGDDAFEDFTAKTNDYWGDGSAFNAAHFSASTYRGQEYTTDFVDKYIPSAVKTNPSDLFKLFWYTAQKTQYYASDNWDAIENDSMTGNYNNYYATENGNCTSSSPTSCSYFPPGDSTNIYLWKDETPPVTIVYDKAVIEDGHDYIGDDLDSGPNLAKIAEANIPHAMKAVAGLYQLFWKSVDADGDGYNNYYDCDYQDGSINPGAYESGSRCTDGKDNDCDGFTDSADPGCASPNKAPTILSVSDNSPVSVGTPVTFTATWSDPNSDSVLLKICKFNSLSGTSCAGGSWCETYTYDSTSPTSCSFSPAATGTSDYYAFVCDNGNACSSYLKDSFTVNPTPNCDYTSYTSCSSAKLMTSGEMVSNMCGIQGSIPDSYQYYKIAVPQSGCRIKWTLWDSTGGTVLENDNYAMSVSADFVSGVEQFVPMTSSQCGSNWHPYFSDSDTLCSTADYDPDYCPPSGFSNVLSPTASGEYYYARVTRYTDPKWNSVSGSYYNIKVELLCSTAPTFSPLLPDKDVNEDTFPQWEIDLWQYVNDAETPDDQLTFSITSQTNPSLISCTISSNQYLNCGMPAANQYGYSDVTVKVADPEGFYTEDTMRVNVLSVNDTPTASFTVTPASGDTTTVFSFDASASSDVEDSSASLQVRWDWENDGVYDTEYSTTKTATHQYTTTGTKTIKLEVKDTGTLTHTTTRTITVNPKPNTPPTASFTVTPTRGTNQTIFNFDAGASSDAEDPASALEVRWDWKSDGTWDTPYSTTKTATHQYPEITTLETITVTLEVKDTGGLTDTEQTSIIVGVPPTIISAADAPDPVTEGNAVTFTVGWSHYGPPTEIKICKTDSITFSIDPSCIGGSWCETTTLSWTSPSSCSYTTTSTDLGTQNYYAFVCDMFGFCSSSLSGTFTVNPVSINYPPVLDPIGDKLVDENSLLTFTLTATDPDNDALTYSSSNLPTGATFDPLTHTFNWTPTYDQAGIYSNVHFEVSDSSLKDWEDITITVNNVNRAPTANDQNLSLNEDTPLNITLTATDPDGDTLTYIVVTQPTNGILTGTAPNVTYTPNQDYHGSDSFTLKANDGLLDSNTATISLTINSVNDAPVLDSIGNKYVNENSLLTFRVTASDQDGGSLTYSASNLPTGASFDALTQTFTWTPTYNQAGTYPNVHFEVSDGIAFDSEDITITVNNVNRVPTANNQNVSTNEDTPVNITLTGFDLDGDILTYIVLTQPLNGTLTGTAPNLTYTPNQDYYGTDSFTFKVNDGELDSNIATVFITVNPVNDAPTADVGADVQTETNKPVTLSGSGTDIDGTIASYSWILSDGTGKASDCTISGENTQNLTVTCSTTGIRTTTLTVTDNDGATGSDSAMLTVTSVTPPETEWQKTFGGIDSKDSEGGYSVQQTNDLGYIITGYTTSLGAGLWDVYLIKTDSNGNKVWEKTFGGINEDRGHSVQQTSDKGYIIAGYTDPIGGQTPRVDFYLIKTDSSGTKEWEKTFGGTEHDFGYSVQQTSDGGYIVAGSTYLIPVGTGPSDVYLIKTDSSGNKLWEKTFGRAEDYDVGRSVQQTNDGGYIIAGYSQPYYIGGSPGVYLIKTDSNGNKLWEKTFGSAGDEGYSVQQTSDEGYIIAGVKSSDVYLIKTDSSGNKLWEKTFGGASRDSGRSVQQTSDAGFIIGGDTESFGAGSWDIYLIKTDSNGEIEWEKIFGGTERDFGYSVQQTNDSGYIIAGETFSYGEPDGAGGYDVYLIKLKGTNTTPILSDIPDQSTDEDTAPPSNWIDLCQYVSDLETPCSGLTFTITTETNSTLIDCYITSNQYVDCGTPAQDQSGFSDVTVRATDPEGLWDEDTFRVTVGSVSEAPVLDPIGNKSVNENSTLTFTVTATDPDGDKLTYSASNLPTGATFDALTQTFSWTPNYTQAGTYPNVHFEVSDGIAFDLEDITITVNNVNRVPTANNQSLSLNEDSTLNITLTGTDPDGDSLTYYIVTQPIKGKLTGTAPNLTYTPNLNYYGSDSFTFKVNDGVVDSNIATVSITINSVNDAPQANNQSVSTPEDTPKNITLTGTDVDGDTLTYIVVTQPLHGTLTGTAPNLTYTPNANYFGSDSFTFKANDGKVDSNIATISLTINSVNDSPFANAGPDVFTYVNQAVTLSGLGTDIDGTISSYSWSLNPSTNCTFSGQTTANLTVTCSTTGNRTATLIVTDNDGATGSDSAVVTNNPIPTPNPFVKVVKPNGGETIKASDLSYVVEFEVQDPENDKLKAKLAYSLSPGAFENYLAPELTLSDTTSLKAVFLVSPSSNSYFYADLTNVSDYTIQSGDVLEYDVYWQGSSQFIAFDYTTSDNTSLRDSGAVDQNNIHAHPGADLSIYAADRWYHRQIKLPPSHYAKTIIYYDIASESDQEGKKIAYLDNILITDGRGNVRKVIYQSGSVNLARHLYNSSNLSSITPIDVLLQEQSLSETQALKTIFSVSSSSNSYFYADLTHISDYTVQSGDVLEYDVYWQGEEQFIAFDYTTSDSTSLRDSGAADQNNISAHPGADLSQYATNQWYHRKIILPSSHLGKTITYFDLASESNQAGPAIGYLDNILITDGQGNIRKVIYQSGSVNIARHLSNQTTLYDLFTIDTLEEGLMTKNLKQNYSQDTDFTNTTRCKFTWSTTHIPAGNYYLDIQVTDSKNTVNDSSDNPFSVTK